MQTGTEGFPIRTVTMAKIFAQQGHYDKAIEIYRHLLKKDPDRHDLAEALSRTEEKQSQSIVKAPRDVAYVLSEYIRLLLNYRQLLDLQAIQRQIATKNRSK